MSKVELPRITKKDMKHIKKVNEAIGNLVAAGKVDYEVSYRGGHYGFDSGYVVDELFPQISDEVREKILDFMPRKFGAACNYLGGGLRGAIFASDFDSKMPEKYADPLRIFARVCVTKYKEMEDEMHLNDEEYPDGETNWEAMGTNASRNAGIISGY